MSEVKKFFQSHFGISPEHFNDVVGTVPTTLKSGVPYSEAVTLWVELESVGAQIKLEPMGNPPEAENITKDQVSTRNSRPKTTLRKSYVVMLAAAFVVVAIVVAGKWFIH